MSPISLHLDRLLVDQGITVPEFARLIGCDRSFAWRIVHGKRRPGRRLALVIERATFGWKNGPVRAADWDAERRQSKRAA
jgi:hypothetical protein